MTPLRPPLACGWDGPGDCPIHDTPRQRAGVDCAIGLLVLLVAGLLVLMIIHGIVVIVTG
jgi:hypothetical protein